MSGGSQNIRVVNLTPHDIHICDENGKIIYTIPRSGVVARVQQEREHVGALKIIESDLVSTDITLIPLVRTRYGEVQGLPSEPEPNTYYIVSLVVAQALANDPRWRGRLLTPDTGPGSVVRDSQGRIIGVRYLIVW